MRLFNTVHFIRLFEYEYELTDIEVGKTILKINANIIQNHFTMFKTSIPCNTLIIKILYQTISGIFFLYLISYIKEMIYCITQ